MYTFLKDDDRRIIEAVVAKLPEEVQDFVNTECEFLCLCGGQNGHFVQNASMLIILTTTWRLAVSNGLHLHAESVVAHEIAHAWLAVTDEKFCGNEMITWNQVAIWGWDIDEMDEERCELEGMLGRLRGVVRPLNATVLIGDAPDPQGDTADSDEG